MFDSTIEIDNVVLEGVAPPVVDVQLDPVFDTGVVGDNLTTLAAVDLIGSTDPDSLVSIDWDGDGTDDAQVDADFSGAYRFASVALSEGANDFRVTSTNSVGSTATTITVDRDSLPPTPVLNAPLPGAVTNVDSGFIEVTWTDVGVAGVDPETIDLSDVTITGVNVNGVDTVSPGRVRYSYTGSLPEGPIEVAFDLGAVADLAGASSVAATETFTIDRLGPTGSVVAPIGTTGEDLGYVDVQWTDVGLAGFDVDSIDPTDITISGVDVDTAQHLGSGLVRYHYNVDGDKLTAGNVVDHGWPGRRSRCSWQRE